MSQDRRLIISPIGKRIQRGYGTFGTSSKTNTRVIEKLQEDDNPSRKKQEAQLKNSALSITKRKNPIQSSERKEFEALKRVVDSLSDIIGKQEGPKHPTKRRGGNTEEMNDSSAYDSELLRRHTFDESEPVQKKKKVAHAKKAANTKKNNKKKSGPKKII